MIKTQIAMTKTCPQADAQCARKRMGIGGRTLVGHCSLIIVLLLSTFPSPGQTPTTQPSILASISTESQKLYESVRPSLVVIRFPATRWLGTMENDPLRRWEGRIDPNLQRKLVEAQRAVANIGPATQPTSQPATQPDAAVDREVNTGPRFLAFVVDDNGHLVVPIYVEREVLSDLPVDVTLTNGRVLRAKFVGSDRKTNLTVLKVEESPGHPVVLGVRPSEGALVMALAASGEAGQLLVWTGGMDDNVIVISVDGKLAGFARAGQFLSGESCRGVIDQLIRFGKVKRAALGVEITQVQRADGKSGVSVVRVLENSPAAHAGLQPGDVILSLKGQPTTDVATFAAAIAGGEGATALEVLRNGAPIECQVILRPQ